MKIVIKVGTSTLTCKDGGLYEKYISDLAKTLSELQDAKNQIILVSSGAIGAGMGKLGLQKRPGSLRQKQALAAIGQPIIMNAYAAAFKKHSKVVAQVLLTRDDFDDKTRFANVCNTLTELLSSAAIPIINENDTTAVEEINFGDNDSLAALVAAAVKADKLIIFTDVDGLYDGDPSKGKLISRVDKITPEIESYASPKSQSGKGVGGMKTKVLAAKIATASGVDVIITNGAKLNLLGKIIKEGGAGTHFPAKK